MRPPARSTATQLARVHLLRERCVVESRDVERIVRDVVSAQALDLSVVRLDHAWRVTVSDAGGRSFANDVPIGTAASVRLVVGQWLDAHV